MSPAPAPEIERWLALAHDLVVLPTAPLMEHLPAAHVRAFAQARPALAWWADEVGNTVVAAGEGPPALVLVAHLDHPAFVVEADGRLAFRGGVREGHAWAGDPVVLHRAGDPVPTGRGRLAAVEHVGGRLTGARLRVTEGEAVPGGFAMWDLAPWEVDVGRVTARVCDDLMGAGAILAVLDELDRKGHDGAAVWGLFTRGEEIGLLGAFEAIRLGTVASTAAVLSLECSKALVHAPQGDGVIVRVGDAATIFHPGITAALWTAAGDVGVAAQRRLMDGGSCEATAFCSAGYRSGGLALPLAGYHNQSDEGGGIVAESVLVADYEAEVTLLLAMAARPQALDNAQLPAWVADGRRRAATTMAAAEPIA